MNVPQKLGHVLWFELVEYWMVGKARASDQRAERLAYQRGWWLVTVVDAAGAFWGAGVVSQSSASSNDLTAWRKSRMNSAR